MKTQEELLHILVKEAAKCANINYLKFKNLVLLIDDVVSGKIAFDSWKESAKTICDTSESVDLFMKRFKPTLE